MHPWGWGGEEASPAEHKLSNGHEKRNTEEGNSPIPWPSSIWAALKLGSQTEVTLLLKAEYKETPPV